MGKQLRENAKPRVDGWSIWVRAMVPSENENAGVNCEERNTDQVGLMCRDIKNVLPEYTKHSGIYEWTAVGTRFGQKQEVVYMGSTCRDKPGALRRRILEYC
ncbi:hypothetical protein, partial [Salmonella sp. s51933]|uniref:hypothetical protein n=1 Tax=Salmonella sp. s51933 TaxID=3160127 RepID=UPI0037545780